MSSRIRSRFNPSMTRTPTFAQIVYGPLVLFTIADEPVQLTRREILSAQRLSPEGGEWQVGEGDVRLLPFWSITNQQYFTYLSLI